MYQRKDGLWADSVSVPGQKRPKYFYGKTKADVKKKMAAWQATVEKGHPFREAADAWDSYHSDLVSVNAHATYKAPLKRAIDFFKDTPIKEISPAEIQAFIRSVADKGFSRRSVQLHRDMINMIFNYYITLPGSSLKYNPVSAVKMPKNLPKTRRLPPTEEQLKKVSPDADSEMGLFAYFLLYTGLRRAELLGLKWDDIDRKAKLINVEREIIYQSNQPIIADHTKTEAGIRKVDLLDALEEVLPIGQKGFIFGGEKPLSKTEFRKRWIKFCREIGEAKCIQSKHKGKNGRTYTCTEWKPLITPHQFRHAYASMLDDAGIDDVAAKTMLGHKSIVTTKDIYTHLRAAKKARSTKQLNEYIASKKASET